MNNRVHWERVAAFVDALVHTLVSIQSAKGILAVNKHTGTIRFIHSIIEAWWCPSLSTTVHFGE